MSNLVHWEQSNQDAPQNRKELAISFSVHLFHTSAMDQGKETAKNQWYNFIIIAGVQKYMIFIYNFKFNLYMLGVINKEIQITFMHIFTIYFFQPLYAWNHHHRNTNLQIKKQMFMSINLHY